MPLGVGQGQNLGHKDFGQLAYIQSAIFPVQTVIQSPQLHCNFILVFLTLCQHYMPLGVGQGQNLGHRDFGQPAYIQSAIFPVQTVIQSPQLHCNFILVFLTPCQHYMPLWVGQGQQKLGHRDHFILISL